MKRNIVSMRPVSFGSIMAFTLKENKYLPQMLQHSFTSQSTSHRLDKDFELVEKPQMGDVFDGTVFNATKDIAKKLDNEYEKELKVNPRKVFLTPINLSDRHGEIHRRYFLTAATQEDEDKIHKGLCGTPQFLVAKFNKNS